MPLHRNKLKEIYGTLKSGGFERTYDDFESRFAGSNNYSYRKKIYDLMSANGDVDAPSYEDWMKELHFVQTVKKAAPKAVANQSPQTVAAVPLTEDKKRQLQADMDLMQADMDLTMRQAELDMQDARERTKKPLNVRKMNLTGGNNIFDNSRVRERKKARYDGRDETVYLTESGNEYGSRAMADVEQGQLDEARFMRENKRAYLMREKERIEREMNQRRGEVKRVEEEEYKKIWDGPLKYLSSMPRGGGVGFNPSADNLGVWGDKKYKTLNAQLKQVEDALATLDEAEAGKKSDAWIADSSNAWERNAKKLAGFGGGAWRGLAHSVGKISTWDFGITDMETNKSVLDAANAVDKGTEATKEDQELLDLVAYKNMVEKESEPYLGYGYTAGSITGESLPFMLEMAINPASGVGKGAMKASMRGMLKKYGKEKLKSNFKKYLLAKAGARVAGDVAGAHAMALTTGQGRVIADTMRRLTGDVQYGVNDNGQIVYSGRKVDVDGLAEAYFKSFESQAIENHSEMLGEYFAPLLTRAGKAIGKPIGKGLEKLRLGGVNRFIEDVGASKTAKLIDDFSKKTQWNGSIGEYAEEVAGGIENAMIVGDQTLDTDEQTGVFNLEKNIETFLGVGLMGGFMFGAKLASYRGPKRGALQEMEAAGNRVDRALGGKMQARAQWGEWRSKLLLGNAEEKKNTLREIMDNEKLPIQFRNAVADFSRAAQKYEGLCRAEQSKRLEGTADPVGSSLDDAADAGYELNDPQEMTRTRLALENERERMAAYLGVEVDQVDATVGENLFDYVDDLRNRGVTGEELNRVMDYARARSRYEGMQMRLEDDTNTRIDNVHANMARYAHRENGTVQTGAVKTKDGSRPVWIVSGNLVFEGEGKDRGVNPVKSDESIFVIDAKTGQVEMHPATDFVSLGEPVSAEEVNAYYESSVREQMKKAFEANTHAELSEEKPAAPANETEGAAVEPAEGNATESTAENATEPAKPAYEVGDVVTLETEDGPVSVEVQAVTADGVEVRTDEPWRGQVVQVIPTEEFEGMMKKPVVEAGVGVEESSATESDRYTEGSPERVEAGDNLIVTDEEGNDRSLKVVRRVSMKPSEKGGLEPQEDANGKIVELVDDATGETVRMWDSELAERTKGYMRPVSGSEVGSGESSEGQQENPQQGVMPSPKSTEGEGVEQAEQAAPAAEPVQPKRDEIPVDEKTGEPVYEAADPGAAWDALVEEAEGDEELAMETVNAMVRDMEEKVKKAKNAKLRAGATAHEKMEAQKERKRHIAEAEERLESWKRIAGVKAERAAAAEASVVESSVSESPVVESPVAESPATVETPAAEEATPVQEGAQTPVQEGARGGVQVPHADSAGQEATQDSVTGTAPVAEQTGTTPKGVEAIPTRKNNKGEEEVLYHKVPVARTMADLYDGGMDQEEIDGFVEANSAEAAREVKRIEGKKPKMTTNKAKYMEAKRAWQAELDEAREKEAYWKEVGKEVKRVTHRDEAPVSAEGRGHEAALGEDMPKDEPMDVYEVVASALGRGRIKITPESFRAETGYSVNDQKKYPGMVAKAENGGVSVERAAEMLMEDADMAGFPSDDYTIRQAIIDVLQDGHPAGYISRRREEARRRAAERDEREREEYYQDRYGMNADDGMAYEETAVPNALNQYGGVSEDELAAQSAEAAEAERMKREEDEQGNRAEDGGQQMAGKEEDAGNEAASEVEEGGRQMEGEEKADTFSLSEMDSGKGGRLYQDAAGNTNLVSIPNEVFEAMGMSPVPFSLTESMAEHVLKHKTELGLSSKEDAVRYVVAVMKNADHVRAGDKPGSFVFSVENGRRKVGKRAIAVQVDGSSGKFLGISTSGNERVSNLQKRPLLWEKGVNETSATGSAPANVTSETAEQNGGELDGNASNQSNDLSVGKVTESKETEQGKGENAGDVPASNYKRMHWDENNSLEELEARREYLRNFNRADLSPAYAEEQRALDELKERYPRDGEKSLEYVPYDEKAKVYSKYEPQIRKEVKEYEDELFELGSLVAKKERAAKAKLEGFREEQSAPGKAEQVEDSEAMITESKETEQVGARDKAEAAKSAALTLADVRELAKAAPSCELDRAGRERVFDFGEIEKEFGFDDSVLPSRRASVIESAVRAFADGEGERRSFEDFAQSYHREEFGPVIKDEELRRLYDLLSSRADRATSEQRAAEAKTEKYGEEFMLERLRQIDGLTQEDIDRIYKELQALQLDMTDMNHAEETEHYLTESHLVRGMIQGVAMMEHELGKVREERAHGGAQAVSEAEAGLRDALVDVARAAGVEVVTDSKEGQRVLDEVNGKARKMAFGEEYDYNQFPVGRVEPELLSRSVEIVPAEKNHGFANYDEAKTWAKDHIVRTLTNEESGGKGRVKISGAAVGKYLSESAVAKSDNRDVHLAVLRVLPDVICKSIEVETTPDFKKDENGVRKAGNEINKDVLIHRCYGAVEIDGQVYRVKVTLKEYRDENEDNKAYSYEATKIELLAGTLANDRNSTTDPGTNSSLSAAKLLNGVMMSYDSSKNVLDESAKMSALVREHRVFHGSGAEFDAFDHSHMGEGEGARFFKTDNGEAYGFTVGGKVYLDPKIATTETAVHELTHLWADMLRKENPKEWKHVVELMKGTPVWDEVKAKYPELKTEDEIADEVLAHYSGRRGAERLRAEQQRLAREEGVSMLDRASAVAAIERVKDALNSFWKKVADLLGIHFKSAEEVADAALADILNGRVKLTAAEGMKEDRKELVAVHNITKDKLKQAMELGGFPMPSIAITKAGVGHTSFGDISLVFDKESINPTDKRNKVYGEDAWTPVFPGVGYKLNDKKTAEIYRRANNVAREKDLPFYNPAMFHPDNYINKVGANGVTDLVEYFKNSYDAKQMYLAEMGNAVTEYVKREEEKYSPKHIRLYEKMLEEIGLERLQNESLEELRDEIKRLYKEYGDVDIDQKPQRVERAYLDGAKRKAVDYALHGNRNVVDDVFATQREIDGRIDQQQFEEWLGEMFSGIVEKKGVRNDKDAYTPSGNARKWEQLYDEITLDNVVAAMQKQAAKGGEGLFGRNIFGSAQAEYKSIDEIRKAAKERIRTINEEEYQTQRSAITDRLSAIEIPGSGSGFLGSMEMEQHIHDAVSKSHTAKGIHKYLKKFYPGITMETAEEIADIVQDIQHMSARYFEAKPYRAVGFDEVKLAVVPSDMDAALKERLEQMGIEVRTYASGDQAQRKQVVDEATEELRIRFQLVGEKGAANMDKAEEATTRLDNLSVAREMEEAFEEKKKRIEKLRKSDSVVVDGNEYLGKYELNSKSAGDYILSSLRRGYKNTDTNELIHISRKSQKVAHHDAENEVHLKSIAYIPQLIEHAIFIDEIPNSKSKNGFDSYRYYVVGFNIGGVDYTVRLTVGVKNGQSYYDHALTKIEKGNLLNLTDGVKADVSEKETAISDVKDKRLLSLLRMNEQENARKIKLATGWERGADGKWRYEVGDIGRMNFLGNARFIRNNPDAQRYGELNYKKLASLLIGGEKLTEEEEEEFSKLVKKFSGELDFNKKPMSKGNQLTLGDYFDADELFAAYPELEDVPVYAEQLEDGVLGYASEADSDFMGFGPVGFMNSLGKPVSSPYKIVVSQDFLEEAAKTLDESVKRRLQSVFIHEIQHLIQEIEGFAKGGSATTYRNHLDELKWGHDVWSWAMEFEAKHQELGKDASREYVYYELVNEFKEDGHEFGDGYAPSREVFDKAYEVWTRGYDNMGYEAAYNEYQYLTGKFGLGFENNRYHQLAGEVEARNVQSRMDMTAEERRASLVEETEDVAREDQVFIMDGIESANSLGDNTSFENRQQRAVQERGVVPAGLNDASIKVEEIPAHPYEGRWSEARSAAIEDAYLKYSEEREVDGKKVREPKSLVYANHGRRFTYTISRGSLKESVNPKQIDKSKKGGASPGVHLAVLNHLDKVIANSIEVEEHPDYIKGKDGVRGPENGYTRGMLVHRFVGAVRIDGQEYIVKTTMHEHSRAEQGTRQYAYDVTKIAVLNVETPNTATGLTTATKGVLPLANVLNGFEKSYDPGKNLLEESKKEDRRFAESVGEQESDGDLYRNVFGGNSGYVGYSMSRRASKARSEGRFPKGDFKREYGLTDTMLNLLVENGAVSNSEWHHTSMFGNRTPFYGWEDYALEAFEENAEELNRIARSRKLTASEKQEAIDKIMNESMDKKRAIEESAAGEQQRRESEYAVYRKEAESSQPARYEASNGAVVVKGTEGLEVYNSQGERLTKRNGKLERNAAIEEYNQKFAPAGFNQWMKDTHPEVDNSAYREVEQGELLDELRKASKEGRTVRVYRTMQVIDGKLYSPMAKKVAGQETSEIKFRWEAAEEHPELARRGDGSKAMPNEDSFYITIDKGQGKGALTVAYNPYTHTSRTVLNDQFSSAFVRPNLVVVEVEVPESELEGFYKAEKAKDSVGEMSWHSGAVSGKLAELGNPRKVILSRYDRPVRILTKKEEAELIAKQLEGTGIAMPYNLVTPQVREELEKLGVKIDEKPSGSVSKNASFGKAEYVTDEQIEAMNGRLQANAVSSPEAMTEAARALSEQLGVPVEIVTDVDSITHPNEAVEVKRRRAKGWYDKRTGKVAIVVPNHLDVEDVAATVFHEVVAHRGLRELVGEQGYDEFLMEVFNHSKADVRERMMALAGKHGWDIPKAVDEYLGGLAERGFDDFSEAERGMWTWLKEKVLEAIDKFIGTLKLPKSVKLGDNELRYLLWRSHENLRAGREGMVKRAMDVAKRYELGLLENEAGERMIDGLETYRSAENRGNTRALPIRERAKAVAHLKPVLVERNEMSKEELRQIYNALPDAVKDGRSISFFHSAFKKNYKEGGLFAQVLPKLNEILKGSVFAYSEKDNRGGEVRPDGTVHKYHPNANAFDNYVGKVEIDGKEYYVRITVQEQQGQVGTHSFFVTSVDVYEKPVNGLSVPNFPSGESDHQRVVDAKLRQFFDEARREDKASEEEDLYRTAYHEAAARDAYERRVKSGLYQSREALQDSMLGLRTAMEEVLKAEGNGYSGRVEDIPGFENAYLGENRLSSVNQAEVDEFGRRQFKPLLEIAASFGSSKEARQALTDYMMAKHGLERNALMRERAKKKAMEELEGDALQKKLNSIEKRDFAGLTALTGEKKVADAEQAARKMVADFEQALGQNGDPNRIDKLWKAVRGVTGATLKKMKDSGLITKEQFDEISGMYDFYIPLRGFDGQTAEDVYDYLGHGGNGSAFTSPIKKAEGRKSKADDPFAYMAAMAESAIMQGNRNVLVKQKFLNFVLNHPSDLVSVSDLWLRYDAAAGEWRVAQSGDIAGTEKLEEGDSPEEVERKMAVFEERMQAEAKAHPKEYKRQKEHPEIPYRVVEKQDLREHQVIVKRNGRDYVLTINGSPRAAQALNGLTNPNLDVSGVAGTLMNGVRNTTNYLSQVYTTRNPNFVGSNWVRDAVYSNIMAGLKEDKEYGLKFSKAWLEANPGSMSKLYYLYEHGKLDMNNEKQRLFAEFMANGGETGYMSFRQIEERKNEIERQLKLYGGKMSLKKGWSDAWNLVDYANRVVENQSRFAAYMASRRSGRTIDRSIYDAKEITVNFNKKGAGSTFYNAKNQTLAGKVAGGVSGIGRFGFAFWNAAIQGTTNFARFVKRNPKKGVAFSLATMALGYVVPLLASIFHDDDDDKEGSGYFDLPDAVRRDNFVFRFPGMNSWITIPLPVEYRALYGLGELTATAMYRASTGMPMTAGEIAGQAMGQISQLMPLDLSEGGGMDFTWGASGNFNALAPSAVKPVAEAWTNKSWTGLPVYKDTPYNKQDPEWTKAFKNTNTFLVKMCKQLNEWTGGDSVKGGAVDLNPAVMEHLLKGYLGGYMQTANQFGKLGETVFGDRENEFRNWPVVSRFLQEGDERTKWRAVTERYFNLKKEAEETDRQLKRYKRLTELGDDHQADIDELVKTDAYKRMEVYDFFENDIRKIQDVLKRNDLSDEERKQVEGELNEIRLELLKAVDELGNLTGLGTGRLGAVTGDLLAE